MSPQKHAAQISNAVSSTGPRTWEGKERSSQNRIAHGLSSRKHKIAPADRAEFERHYNEMLAELAPVGAVESQLAEAIVIDLWRMARARQLENEIFIKGIAEAEDRVCPAAETWAKNARELALLTLYSQRIHRVLVRNQADFAAMQSAREASKVRCDLKPDKPAATQVAASIATSASRELELGFVCSPVSWVAPGGRSTANSGPFPAASPQSNPAPEAQIAA